MGLTSLMRRLFGSNGTPDEGQAPPRPTPLRLDELPLPGRPGAALFDRLPPALGDHLVCLEARGRRAMAHTLAGNILLPIALKDAIAELGGIEGMQVHRSWWVARENVRAVRRDGRNLRLELANGMLAPVARNKQEALKREGWL